MAIINPSNLFSAGNVALDSTPYLRISEAQKARQKAIDEAAYRHYSELPDKLNSAGVRAQDWEDPNGNGGIGNDIENTKRFFIENSKDILKGGQAASKYSRMMQDNLRKIAASKAVGKFQVESGKAFFDGKHRYRENDLRVKDAVDKSMYDPAHYKDPESKLPYSFSDLSVAAAPYTSQVEMAHNKNITNGIVPDKDPTDKGVLDDIAKKVTYRYVYSPEKLKQIGLNASTDAANSTTLGNKYEDMLSDPAAIQRATTAGQSVYGKDFIADTKEKMAAGTKIAEYAQMKIPKTLTDLKSIQDWKDADREDRQAQQTSENSKRRAQSEKNAKIIAAKWETTDPYEIIQKNVIELPTKEFDQTSPFGMVQGKNIRFAPFTGMSEKEIQDVFGASDGYARKIPTVQQEVNGVMVEGVMADEENNLYDAEGKPVDRLEGITNKATRIGSFKKQEAKGQVKVTPTGKQPEKKEGKFNNL